MSVEFRLVDQVEGPALRDWELLHAACAAIAEGVLTALPEAAAVPILARLNADEAVLRVAVGMLPKPTTTVFLDPPGVWLAHMVGYEDPRLLELFDRVAAMVAHGLRQLAPRDTATVAAALLDKQWVGELDYVLGSAPAVVFRLRKRRSTVKIPVFRLQHNALQ
jgi:hypothetical protein